MRPRHRSRPRGGRSGFTLIELLVAMIIAGVIGAAFTRLLVSQTRFFNHEMNIRQARSVARGASNVMLADLRMVQGSTGVLAAAADGDSITLTVPYRFGLVCSVAVGVSPTTVSMLPTDSGTIATALYAGWAWRNTATGLYNIVTATSPLSTGKPVTSANPSNCTSGGGAQITSVSMNGRTGDIMDIPTLVASGATVGTTMFFWQKITYKFAASTAFPGKIGLWRNVSGAATPEEIMGPFDSSAHFEYYQSGSDTPTTAPPALSLIRGFDLVLNATSAKTVSGGTASTRKVVTSVFFKNLTSS